MNPIVLIGLIGGAVGLAAAAVNATILAEVEKARDELIEVGPNCSFIKVVGFSDDGETPTEAQVNRAIAKARRYYFNPKIAQVRKLFPPAAMGLDVYAAAARGFILKDLIPGCDWSTRPSIGDPRFFVYITLGNWIRIEALTGLECDPLEEPPAGMICALLGGKTVLQRKNI